VVHAYDGHAPQLRQHARDDGAGHERAAHAGALAAAEGWGWGGQAAKAATVLFHCRRD
jgi:hypothetical protein